MLSQHLETRVAALETELAQMRQMPSVFVQNLYRKKHLGG
jgi:hypothetical protein